MFRKKKPSGPATPQAPKSPKPARRGQLPTAPPPQAPPQSAADFERKIQEAKVKLPAEQLQREKKEKQFQIELSTMYGAMIDDDSDDFEEVLNQGLAQEDLTDEERQEQTRRAAQKAKAKADQLAAIAAPNPGRRDSRGSSRRNSPVGEEEVADLMAVYGTLTTVFSNVQKSFCPHDLDPRIPDTRNILYMAARAQKAPRHLLYATMQQVALLAGFFASHRIPTILAGKRRPLSNRAVALFYLNFRAILQSLNDWSVASDYAKMIEQQPKDRRRQKSTPTASTPSTPSPVLSRAGSQSPLMRRGSADRGAYLPSSLATGAQQDPDCYDPERQFTDNIMSLPRNSLESGITKLEECIQTGALRLEAHNIISDWRKKLKQPGNYRALREVVARRLLLEKLYPVEKGKENVRVHCYVRIFDSSRVPRGEFYYLATTSDERYMVIRGYIWVIFRDEAFQVRERTNQATRQGGTDSIFTEDVIRNFQRREQEKKLAEDLHQAQEARDEAAPPSGFFSKIGAKIKGSGQKPSLKINTSPHLLSSPPSDVSATMEPLDPPKAPFLKENLFGPHSPTRRVATRSNSGASTPSPTSCTPTSSNNGASTPTGPKMEHSGPTDAEVRNYLQEQERRKDMHTTPPKFDEQPPFTVMFGLLRGFHLVDGQLHPIGRLPHSHLQVHCPESLKSLSNMAKRLEDYKTMIASQGFHCDYSPTRHTLYRLNEKSVKPMDPKPMDPKPMDPKMMDPRMMDPKMKDCHTKDSSWIRDVTLTHRESPHDPPQPIQVVTQVYSLLRGLKPPLIKRPSVASMKSSLTSTTVATPIKVRRNDGKSDSFDNKYKDKGFLRNSNDFAEAHNQHATKTTSSQPDRRPTSSIYSEY